MKHYLLMLLLLLPGQSFASYTSSDIWFCRVVGNVDETKVMFVTPLWEDTHNNHYQEREKAFIKHLQYLTKNKFNPAFQAKCRDYLDKDRAEKHRQLEMKTAKKYDFEVKEIPWKWKANHDKTKDR